MNSIDRDTRKRSWTLATPLPKASLSVELFPPKDASSAMDLMDELDQLQVVQPSFFSVTCGAGGGSNKGTFDIVQSVREHTGVPVAAHMTCVGRTKDEIDELADQYWEAGVRHLVALRGDPPKGTERYEPTPGGYAYASDLIKGLKRRHDFKIDAACYPETHPEAANAKADLDSVKRKVDNGATRLLGQYCFDTERVLRYRDELHAHGIDVPFGPGVMPIRSFKQITRFSAMCGASIPRWLAELYDGVPEGSDLHKMISAMIAAEQSRRLVAEGFDHLHIYALNRAELTLAVWHLLGSPKEMRMAA